MDKCQKKPHHFIKVVYNENKRGLKLKPHFHNSYEMIYILEGKVKCRVNNKHYVIGKDCIIFINNMESHNIDVLEYPYKRFFILISPDFFRSVIQNPLLSSVFSNRSESFKHVLQLDEQRKTHIIKCICSLYSEVEKKEKFWEDAVRSNLNLMFILLYRNYPEYFPLSTISESMYTIIRVQKYIEDHYTENISLDSLSKLFFMNKYYISHQFKKATGFTFKEYLIMQRISKAKDLLLYTNRSITRVCMDSGFNNVNHFIRIFKKFERITPYQYRKKRTLI